MALAAGVAMQLAKYNGENGQLAAAGALAA
jgi:hypothetical protein